MSVDASCVQVGPTAWMPPTALTAVPGALEVRSGRRAAALHDRTDLFLVYRSLRPGPQSTPRALALEVLFDREKSDNANPYEGGHPVLWPVLRRLHTDMVCTSSIAHRMAEQRISLYMYHNHSESLQITLLSRTC